MKTSLITLVFYDSLVVKTNCRNTAIFQSCFSFSLLPPWLQTNWPISIWVEHWSSVRGKVKHELRVQIHELRVQIHELRVKIYELRVQIHELRVKIYELRVQINELRVLFHELRVQIYELRVQIHEWEH